METLITMLGYTISVSSLTLPMAAVILYFLAYLMDRYITKISEGKYSLPLFVEFSNNYVFKYVKVDDVCFGDKSYFELRNKIGILLILLIPEAIMLSLYFLVYFTDERIRVNYENFADFLIQKVHNFSSDVAIGLGYLSSFFISLLILHIIAKFFVSSKIKQEELNDKLEKLMKD